MRPRWRREIADHDLVLDCTDNVAIRNQLNVGCFQHKTPLVSGAAIRMEGQISVFTYQDGEPLLPLPEPSVRRKCPHLRRSRGNGPAGGTIGSLQAMEAISC